MRVGCLDTETTGLDPAVDRVVDFCIRTVGENDARVWRVNPGVPMPEIAAKTHGITDEMVRDLPPLTNPVAAEWVAAIQDYDVLIGYNPDYDIAILRAEFARMGVSCRWPSTVVCCKKMWDHFEPPPPRALIDAYKKFVDPEGFSDSHSAAADVAASILVFESMRVRFGALETSYEDLNPHRALWCGSTSHVVWSDDTRVELHCGFGKNRNKPLHELDVGFFRWIMKNDFPEHVRRIASHLISLLTNKGYSVTQVRDVAAAWARERDK